MENQGEWVLQYLSISRQEYGDKAGQYTGTITFKNGGKMDVCFRLDQAQCQQYLALIQESMTEHAKTLGQALIQSMPIALPQSTNQP